MLSLSLNLNNEPDRIVQPVSKDSFLKSIAKEGDVMLPLQLCILRREETFKQWSARAKRCRIEAVHELSLIENQRVSVWKHHSPSLT
jgi:hypothetical protein